MKSIVYSMLICITAACAPAAKIDSSREQTDSLVDDRLFHKWVLEELNGFVITENDYTREAPRIELKLIDGKILGYSGCNNFFGSLVTRGDKIAFEDIGSTKMFCQKSAETEFFKVLSEARRFEIKDLHLLLYSYERNTPAAIFLKVD
jgi:heat shock protein HslJ